MIVGRIGVCQKGLPTGGINHATMACHPQFRGDAMSGSRRGIDAIAGRSIVEETAHRADTGGKTGAP